MTDVPDNSVSMLQAEAPVDVRAQDGAGDRPWPLLLAAITSCLKPATTARHLQQVGLGKAFAFHALSSLWFFLVVPIILSWVRWRLPFRWWGEIVEEAVSRPGRFFLALGIILSLIEGVAFGLALLLTPWAARDERPRSSLYHAMRMVWLQTVPVAVATSVWLMFEIWLVAEVYVPWYAARDASSMGWDRPWFMRYDDELAGYRAVVVYAWVLWGMLRAVGARSIRRPEGLDPTCQACGYNLTATTLDAMCPECGEAVAASIGPDARPGIDWERKGRLGLRRSWWGLTWPAIRSPRQFGRDLHVYSRPADYQRFLLINMFLAGVLGLFCAAFWLLGFVAGPGPYQTMMDDFVWGAVPMSFILCGLGVLAISLLFAMLAGLAFSWATSRNVLPAAMRCSAYLSGFIVLCLAVNLPCAWLFGFHLEAFRIVGRWVGIDDEIVALIVWIGLNLVWLAVYLYLLRAMVRAARYADR